MSPFSLLFFYTYPDFGSGTAMNASLLEPHVKVFDITGRLMNHWVLVEPEGIESDDQLRGWIERALKFVR